MMVQVFAPSLRAISFTMLMVLVGCDSDEPASGPGAATGTQDGGTPPASTAPDAITEAVLAACPQSTTLIETTEWPNCLAGRRVTGTEPFNGSACELKFGQNGAFEYWRSGAVAFSVPERTGWGDATGTYQNELNAGRRAFLASVAPALPNVEGQPWFQRVTLNIFTSADDTVEIQSMDASRARQIYNCRINVL